MDLVLGTRNSDKISEIQQVLGKLSVRILTFKNIEDLPIVKEDGRSLYENALKKATIISSWTKKLTLSDDSGLEVDVLGNKPGVLSARFSGKNATYEKNNKRLLNLLSGFPMEKRTATFRCVMVLSFPDGRVEQFEGILDGKITTSGKGNYGFGYDPIFFVPELGKTLAELNTEQKNKISHRGKALKKVYRFLKNYIRYKDS
ncbi:MAG: RdgB/HAM1 family non-canonical purine NTP pyrophosphatase [Candidatus Cloacimonadota bacterium]|nr:MAG: RdgB/HAM1 family non-canonical purine NTP pyrophosphatase [Candidatus Cloacimonadota bacterium]